MSLLCDMSLFPFGFSQSTFNQGFSGFSASSVHFTECGFSFTLYLNNRFYISLHLCAFSLQNMFDIELYCWYTDDNAFFPFKDFHLFRQILNFGSAHFIPLLSHFTVSPECLLFRATCRLSALKWAAALTHVPFPSCSHRLYFAPVSSCDSIHFFFFLPVYVYFGFICFIRANDGTCFQDLTVLIWE